jgi:hypothetical protein
MLALAVIAQYHPENGFFMFLCYFKSSFYMPSFTVCCLYATLVFQNNQVVPKQSSCSKIIKLIEKSYAYAPTLDKKLQVPLIGFNFCGEIHKLILFQAKLSEFCNCTLAASCEGYILHIY